MNTELTAANVAQYLLAHPDFLISQPDVFTALNSPNAYEGKALSFQDRQLSTLRQRYAQLELRLAELIQTANTNEIIVQNTQAMYEALLSQKRTADLPDVVVAVMTDIFELQGCELKLWQVDEQYCALPACAPVEAELITRISADTTPQCGLLADDPILTWFAQPMASAVLVPLHVNGACFGALLLGSDDAGRFAAGFATDLVADMGRGISSCLSRLLPA